MYSKLASILLCLYLLTFQKVSAYDRVKEYQELDQQALSAGADKASNYHNYTEVYSQYFAPLKDKPIKFLEIGIYRGESVRLWEQYFKNAELHFIDITLQNNQYSPSRATYHLADQESVADLARVMRQTKGDFDVIIDDGGHTMGQQITSFKTLFPYVKSGGMYIIEDLHTSYWDFFTGGDNSNTAVAYLKTLIDDVNYIGAATTKASHENLPEQLLSSLNTYQKDIYSMHFYTSLVVIIKR